MAPSDCWPFRSLQLFIHRLQPACVLTLLPTIFLHPFRPPPPTQDFPSTSTKKNTPLPHAASRPWSASLSRPLSSSCSPDKQNSLMFFVLSLDIKSWRVPLGPVQFTVCRKFAEIFAAQGAPRCRKWKKSSIRRVQNIFSLDTFG